jgi:carboxyl-terminal processing protease
MTTIVDTEKAEKVVNSAEEVNDKERDRRLNRFSNGVLALAVVFFIFVSGYRLGEYQSETKKSRETNTTNKVFQPKTSPLEVEKTTDLSLFWEVWATLQSKYAEQDKLENEKMVYGAIKGMVASLEDPYTFFLTPKENQESKDDLGGKYEGIGAQLGMKDNSIIVVAPLKNSPAEEAGLRNGDIIIMVDNKSTKGWTLTEAVNNIRGKENTKVTLGIARKSEKEPIQIEIVRQKIKMESVELSYKKQNGCSKDCKTVAFIKVSQFGDTTNEEWDKAVYDVSQKWNKKTISGLVVDMRNNPGGYLDGSVYLASEFLDVGKLVVKQQYAGGNGKDYLVEREGYLKDIPLVVLINEGSASASEIFAGAMNDHDRAKLVGKKTFGKGSVQEALNLENGTGLHVTVAKWILPGGDWINSKGIKPTFEVDNEVKEGNTLTDETDKQMQKAISEILK